MKSRNNIVVEILENKGINYLLKHNAKTLNSKTAFIEEATRNKITFADFYKLAKMIASYLKVNNITFGDTICISIENSIYYYASKFACFLIGARFVCSSNNAPKNRMSTIKKICDVKFTIDKSAVKDILTYKKTIKENEIIKHRNDDKTFIVYTSGTTGEPKCILHNYQSLKEIMIRQVNSVELPESYIHAANISTEFTASIHIDMVPFLVGNTTHIISEETRLNSIKIAKYIDQNRINTIFLYSEVIKSLKLKSESLKIAYIAGSKAENVYSPNFKIINIYGASEVGGMLYFDVDKKYFNTPIGKTTYNNKVYVLNDKFENCDKGELYFAGNFNNFYIKDADLTKKTYLLNPFYKKDGFKYLYKTNDIVEYAKDDNLVFLGRSDHTIKINGQRVNTDEIESAIKALGIVDDVCVVCKKHNGVTSLVALYVSDREISNTLFRYYLCNSLPSFMIPYFYIKIKDMPKTKNGKIDYKKLDEYISFSSITKKDFPKNKEEKAVLGAFKKVFKLDNISVNESFFLLGGNSLQAMEISALLKDYNVTITQIFKYITPRNIAKNIENNILRKIPKSNKYTLTTGVPLSDSQLNIYLDIKTKNNEEAYMIPHLSVCDKRYSLKDVTKALQKIFKVHPILTMRVEEKDNKYWLVKGKNPNIDIVDKFDSQQIIEFSSGILSDEQLCKFQVVQYGGYCIACCLFHHLICDASSLIVFDKSLNKILNNQKVDVDEGFIYASYIDESLKCSKFYKKAKAHFRLGLKNIEKTKPLLPIPGNNSNGRFKCEIDINQHDLDDFINKNLTTITSIFNSVFSYTLSCFTGSPYVFFNMIFYGHDVIQQPQSIGMYIKSLPIVVDCSKKQVIDLMRNLEDSIINYNEYLLFPYSEIRSAVDSNSEIYFQVFLQENNTISTGNKKRDKEISYLEENLKSWQMNVGDFNVKINKEASKYVLRISYSSKYNQQFIESFAKTFQLILDQFLWKENLKDIKLVDNETVKQIWTYNNTSKRNKYNDIVDAFKAGLIANPNKDVVIYKDNHLSYLSTFNYIKAINKKLDNLNIKTGSHIGVFVERSQWYLVASLSILYHGSAYVPIDDKYPDERVSFIIEDSSSAALLVTDNTIERAKKILGSNHKKIKLINLSKIVLSKNQPCKKIEAKNYHKDDTACILYTSGTTGKPKGALITRKAILNVALWYTLLVNFKHDEVFSMYCSFSFDGNTLALFAPMFANATTDIMPDEFRLNINLIKNYFDEHNISHTKIPAALVKLITSNNLQFKTLKTMLAGGEFLGNVNTNTSYTLYDCYGPTEALVDVTAIKVQDKVDSSSVGFMLENCKGYILDEELRVLPIGAVGDLHLSGLQLAKSYLNRKAETEEAFKYNQIDGKNKGYEKIYKTGDVARYLPDGTIGLIGRKDTQVKVRGNRVELGEIEERIRNISYIKSTTVQVLDNDGVNEIVAYVVCNKNIVNLEKDLISKLQKQMPEFMIPSHIVRLKDIQLNVNGKVDKSKLPKPKIEKSKSPYSKPETKNEKIVASAFEELFSIKKVGLDDSFTELGGDSLKAIRLSNILTSKNLNILASEILNKITVKAIAGSAVMDLHEKYSKTSGRIGLHPIQEYYFDQKLDKSYNQFFAIESSKYINLDKLQKCIDKLVDKHDILRANYKILKSGVAQYIKKSHKIKIQTERIEDGDVIDYIKKDIKELVNKLNWKTNNLISIKLINNQYIVFVAHHLIIDGISWNIIINDLERLYNNKTINRPYPYGSWIKSIEDDAKKIKDSDIEIYKKLNEENNEDLIKGPSEAYSIKLNNKFDDFQRYEIKENQLMMLAISRAYKKTYGSCPIFNMETHGRAETSANINNTVGWFTTKYPVKVDVSTDDEADSVIEDLCYIKEKTSDAENKGIEYLSSVYINKKFKYQNFPITYNFLSSEFSYSNNLFSSINDRLSDVWFENLGQKTVTGIDLNIKLFNNCYMVEGNCPKYTFLHKKYKVFLKNIDKEICSVNKQLNKLFNSQTYVYELSNEQLGIYLDEKVNEKGCSYSCNGWFKISGKHKSKHITYCLNDYLEHHPVLKTRSIDIRSKTFGITDAKIPISKIITEKHINQKFVDGLLKKFDLKKYAARFYIVENKNSQYLVYDIHHYIFDASSKKILKEQLKNNIENYESSSVIDLGFLKRSNEKYLNENIRKNKSAKKFYDEIFFNIDKYNTELVKDENGNSGTAKIYLGSIKDSVEKLAKSNNITSGHILTAVFAYTLSRFTFSNKAYFTFTTHGRFEDYYKNSLGMYIRTIPTVVNCEHKDVNSFLKDAADSILTSMEYSTYPFGKLCTEYFVNNNISFEYNADINDMSNVNLSKDVYIKDKDKHKIHITNFLAVVNNYKNGYSLIIEHNDTYSKDTVLNFAFAYKKILNEILKNKRLDLIEYASKKDLKLFKEVNSNKKHFKVSSLEVAVLNSFKNNNNNYIYISEDKRVSYSDVYGKICHVVSLFKKLKIKSGSCVGIFSGRNEYYLISVLAAILYGVTYVPIDDTYPVSRINYMIKDSKVKAVLTTKKEKSRIDKITKKNSNKIKIVVLDNEWNHQTKQCVQLPTSSNNTACVLYTSGTTGKPKGVCIAKEAILNMSYSYISQTNMCSNDIYSMYASVAFDASLIAIFPAIICGGSLSIVPDNIKLDIDLLNEYFTKIGSTHTMITTSVAKLYIKKGYNSKIKYMHCGGEKLGEVTKKIPFNAIDAYGPTESTTYVLSININNKKYHSSVGELNLNTKAYLLDTNMNLVSKGAVGELYLSGPQTALGYINNKKATNEVFVENNFENNSMYKRMYKTGDLFRLLPDNTFGFVGRADNQVKIRGNRVELSEVESCINEISGIKECVVMAKRIVDTNELVAFISLKNKTINEKNIIIKVRRHIEKNKPLYMIPNHIKVLKEIPKNTNLKIDYQKLSESIKETPEAKGYKKPTNDIEQEICIAFGEVLGKSQISINDKFNYIGGDSIKAINISSLLMDKNIKCSSYNIIKYQTPQKIAKYCTAISKDFDFEEKEGNLGLLPIQANFFDRRNLNEVDSFSQYSLLKVNNDVIEDKLDEALLSILDEQSVFNYSYKRTNKKWVQKNLKKKRMYNIEKVEVDLNNEGEILKYIANELETHIGMLSVSENRLYKVVLYKCKKRKYLLFVCHHLIIDAYSWKIIFSSLHKKYLQLVNNQKVKKVAIYPYSKWIKKVKSYTNDLSEEQVEYWKKINKTLKIINPGDANYFEFNLTWNKSNNEFLHIGNQQLLFYACARAYKKVFKDSAQFSTETYGRDDSLAPLNNTVGWFTCFYPLIFNVDGKDKPTSIFSDLQIISEGINRIKDLGISYLSLIYNKKVMGFKSGKITLNYLSDIYDYNDSLFETKTSHLNRYRVFKKNHKIFNSEAEFSITDTKTGFFVRAYCMKKTSINEKISKFAQAINEELDILSRLCIECKKTRKTYFVLSEQSQSEYRENEFVRYIENSCPGYIKLNKKVSYDEVKNIVNRVADKNPVLKNRVIAKEPFLIGCTDCDIKIKKLVWKDDNIDDFLFSILSKFSDDECCSRYWFVRGENNNYLAFELWHVFCDAMTTELLKKKLLDEFTGRAKNYLDLLYLQDSEQDNREKFDYEKLPTNHFWKKSIELCKSFDIKDTSKKKNYGTYLRPLFYDKNKIAKVTTKYGINFNLLMEIVYAMTLEQVSKKSHVAFNTFLTTRTQENANSLGLYATKVPIVVHVDKKLKMNNLIYDIGRQNIYCKENGKFIFRKIIRSNDPRDFVYINYYPNFDKQFNHYGLKEKYIKYAKEEYSDFYSLYLRMLNIKEGVLLKLSHSDKYSQEFAVEFIKKFVDNFNLVING